MTLHPPLSIPLNNVMTTPHMIAINARSPSLCYEYWPALKKREKLYKMTNWPILLQYLRRLSHLLLFAFFICIYISEPCIDGEGDCPRRAASGYCWKTAQPPILKTMYYVGRSFPEWDKCKKSCRRCNGKGWKTNSVQQNTRTTFDLKTFKLPVR